MSRPNILFIMTDDHAAHAMSCYGSRINTTPNLDRIAQGGMRFNNCFCTNSICGPSRAHHPHRHVQSHQRHDPPWTRATTTASSTSPSSCRALATRPPSSGKWHLGSGGRPTGPPALITTTSSKAKAPTSDPEMVCNGDKVQYQGYTTDIITDLSLDWLPGARQGAALLPDVPPQGPAPPLGAGRKTRPSVRRRGYSRAGDL